MQLGSGVAKFFVVVEFVKILSLLPEQKLFTLAPMDSAESKQLIIVLREVRCGCFNHLITTTREGNKQYKNTDHATGCAMTCVGKVNKNNLQQNQPSCLAALSPAASPEMNLTTHYSLKRKSAFTLAEVLITLAIIGVVAALTIQTLIENYKKWVIISKLNKVYTTISQAYISAKADNGELQDWKLVSYTESKKDNEDILYYLLPYLKVQRFCGKSEKGCFPDVGYGSIGSVSFGVNIDSWKWYSNAILVDGTSISSITFGSSGLIRVGGASSSDDFAINRGDYCAAWVIYGKTMDYIKDKKCEPYK